MLVTRMITGFFLILFLLALVFKTTRLEFEVIWAVVMALSAFEWAQLYGFKKLYLALPYAVLLGVLSLASALMIPLVQSLGFLFWAFAFISLFLPRRKINFLKNPMLGLCLGLGVFVPTWGAASLLHVLSPALLLYVFLVVAASDIGAYFAGRLCGKHLLAKQISPKKTIEGAVGGVVLACVVGGVLAHFVMVNAQTHSFALTVLSVPLALVGMLGDLFESQMKRLRDVKDSGFILPGHGGILDRLDSHFPALVFMAFASLWMGWV
ncbi:MAG: phosphatidate cytidylyltransferase [Gammaproteobacteria bacterium]|nr:phosphatidate cytidylyltransferase [Gammaproteobacteria bacterium]